MGYNLAFFIIIPRQKQLDLASKCKCEGNCFRDSNCSFIMF